MLDNRKSAGSVVCESEYNQPETDVELEDLDIDRSLTSAPITTSLLCINDSSAGNRVAAAVSTSNWGACARILAHKVL